MIPLKLVLSGFLSYRDPVTLDFTQFDLACISGANGAGKSSLLDAITWALFGEARKRDESLIHMHPEVKAAEVVFFFAYEGNLYRVQRTLPRNKTSLLEFQVYQGNCDDFSAAEAERGAWKVLTESSIRLTQARIQRMLRMDFDTFINASFFLQGKADEFTQQRAGERKRILSSILGLEVWETYREQAANRRRELEAEVVAIQGGLREINAELAEEEARKARLAELDTNLSSLAKARQTQTTALDSIRRIEAGLAEQRKLVESLGRQVEAVQLRQADVESRLTSRKSDLEACQALLGREAQIRASYADWQKARQELAKWDEIASRFRDQEQHRQGPLEIIRAEGARLDAERVQLTNQRNTVLIDQESSLTLSSQLEAIEKTIAATKSELDLKSDVELELNQARQSLADAKAENPLLFKEMNDLKERINRLEALDSPTCPFCGQPLDAIHRERLIEELRQQGKERGDRYRSNLALLEQADQLVAGLESQMVIFRRVESDLQGYLRTFDALTDRLDQSKLRQGAWEKEGAPRLAELERLLASENYALEARRDLAAIDAELRKIGYDAAAHDKVRRQELDNRQAESDLRELEKALATQAALLREIEDLQRQQAQVQKEVDRQVEEYNSAAATLATAEAQAPDLAAAERELYALQEQENRLRMEVGAARQKVLVLDDLKVRRHSMEAEQEGISRQVGRFKQLERAFGKDGVPALLIEQALPQIEEKANEILDRLSSGSMAVRFVTQAAYKDKRREDLRETLDIQISDTNGTRDYEMYSGGEAFRVNFAIRLALSEVLAQRAGARLQMLVIDEGFGSQDTLGRQRLIEAINLVRPDFAKILVITHIDELKDAFPSRIEVEKTARGSYLRVL